MSILENIYNGDYTPGKAAEKLPFPCVLRSGHSLKPLRGAWAKILSSAIGTASVKRSASETAPTSGRGSAWGYR